MISIGPEPVNFNGIFVSNDQYQIIDPTYANTGFGEIYDVYFDLVVSEDYLNGYGVLLEINNNF